MILPDAADRAAGRLPLALLAFLALMTSMVALTIDAVLPALDAMDRDLAFRAENDRHLVIFAVFLGLGIAQAFVGPLADAHGRKPVALGGIAIFLFGTVIGCIATDSTTLIAGRFLQGLGAAGPRVISVTILRDLYRGAAMARVSSFVNALFVAVPMIAPLIGQGIEAIGGWRSIFWFYGVTGLGLGLWYIMGMPETLPAKDRRPLAVMALIRAAGRVLGTGQTLAAIGIIACAFGGFTAYLATAQQIFEEDYALGPLFPAVFAGLAGSFALASFLNGRLVMRFGMLPLSGVAIALLIVAGGLGAAVSWRSGGLPALPITLALISVVFVGVAILFANMIAVATAPHGAMAGTATSIILAAGTLLASGMGTAVASVYDGSLVPMFAAFIGLGLVAALLFLAIQRAPHGVAR